MQAVSQFFSKLRLTTSRETPSHVMAFNEAIEKVEDASKNATAAVEPLDAFVRDISGTRSRNGGHRSQHKRRARAR